MENLLVTFIGRSGLQAGRPCKTEAREKLLEKLATLGSAAQEDYDLLRRVRNAIAHGTRPQGGDAQRAVQSLEELEKLYRRGRDLFHCIREVRP